MAWSRKWPRCRGCTTIRFRHVGRGLCRRCYAFASKIDAYRADPDPDQFRDASVRWYQEAIITLRTREVLWRMVPHPIGLQELFKRVAGSAGARPQVFDNVAGLLEEAFTAAQRQILYRLLMRIQEDQRHRVDAYRIYGIYGQVPRAPQLNDKDVFLSLDDLEQVDVDPEGY